VKRLKLSLRKATPWYLLAFLLTGIMAWLPLSPVLSAFGNGWVIQDLLDPRTLGLLGNTVALATKASVLAIGLGLPLAILATRTNVLGHHFLRLCIPLPLFVPPLLLAQAWHGFSGADSALMAAICLGLSYAPLPALFAARALRRQSPSSHQAALLAGGPKSALREMVRLALPGACLGTAFAFLFIASDFAVPDYFATVGEKFSVYAGEVFNQFRDQNWRQGARAAAPLLALGLAILGLAWFVDCKFGNPQGGKVTTPQRLQLQKWHPLLQIIFSLFAWLAIGLLVLIPIGQLIWESGAAGPLAEGSWLQRSQTAFADAFTRGRGDFLRSLQTGLGAGAICFFLAPMWARFLIQVKGWKKAFLLVLLALPLLTPAMGLGIGAIVIFNQDWLRPFYAGPWLPILIFAGRFLPIAIFLTYERMRTVPSSQEEAATLAGASFLRRIFRYRMGGEIKVIWLGAAMVAVFSIRELDLAILLPAANASVAVRYFNALHFARDQFVAAFGCLMTLLLFLPYMISSSFQSSHE
jgi:iron(III) transport system permease protein